MDMQAILADSCSDITKFSKYPGRRTAAAAAAPTRLGSSTDAAVAARVTLARPARRQASGRCSTCTAAANDTAAATRTTFIENENQPQYGEHSWRFKRGFTQKT
jgi:hypothetical protein